jgi:RHS repeat-associated protein
MWDPDYGADPACTYEGEEVTVWPAGPYEAECKCTQYEQTEVSNYVPSTDYRGNLTKTTVYPDAATPSGGIAETKRYDETGNVVAESASCCELKSYTYTTGTDYAYPTSMSRGSSDTSSTIRNTSTAAYDYNTGLITLSTDPNSRTTTTAYDANTLRPTQTTSPTGAYSLTTYDESGMTITDEVHDSSAALAGKTITYLNGIGQTKRTDTITGSTIDISQTMYDNLARVWKESRPYRSGDTVYWTEKTYDLLGRVSQITGPDGSTTKAFYNETSRPDSASSNLGSTVRVQDAWGRERWGRYDALDRLVEVAEPNPAGSGSSNGAVLATGGSAPNSLITNYTFDTLGNLTQSNQGGQVRSFKYDSLGRLTRQKLAEETATLDDTGTYVPPDISGVRAGANWSSAFTYDSRSNVTQKVDARGVIATYAYGVGGADDPLNRLQSVSYAPGTTYDTSKPIPPAKSVAYQYMPSGDQDRLQKITVDSTLTDELAYDTEGRVSDVTRTFLTHATYPMVTSYTYDSLNRTTDELDAAKYGLTGSPRKHIQNTFDASSRQTTLTVDGSVQANSVVYNAADQITSFHTSSVAASGNSFTESYTYDPQTGLLTRQKVLLSNRTASLDLSYDYSRNNSAGSLTGQTGQLTKVLNNLDHNKDREYQFDAIGRLTVAKGKATSQWTQNYTFDRWGNRTAVSSSGTAADGSTIPNDGIPALSYDTGNNRITTPGWEYDVAGNQTRALSQDGTNFIRYEYDAANCPVNIKDDSGNVIQSQQFGEGNDRISLTDASASQITYYDGPTEYTEAVGTGVLSWSRSLVYFGDSLLSTATPSVSGSEITEYNHPDGLGARLFSTPGTFHTVAEQAHLPFGNALDAESTRTSFSKRFTSYERSATTGFDYAQNRTYDSRQGRFTQVDPVGMGDVSLDSPQSLNLYSYCQNDPINYRDPSGLGFFSFLKKLFKWLAIIVAVAVIVASVVISHGAASGLLANLADLFAKLGLVSLVSGETAAVSIGISGQIILAAASVGAIDDFAQTKKKKPSPEDVRRRLIRSAINSALWRLRHMPGCKEFVQGNSTIDPIATLEVLRDSGRIFYDPKLGSVSSDGPVAQVPASDVRKGAWSTIHLGDKWFDKKVGGWAGTMNTMRTRTGTILHETKHTVDKGHEDGEANDYYYKEIAKRCFGVTPSH